MNGDGRPDEKFCDGKDDHFHYDREDKHRDKKDDLSPLEDSHMRVSVIDVDIHAATFLDVAVLRCLFIRYWSEEGVYWALQYFYNR